MSRIAKESLASIGFVVAVVIADLKFDNDTVRGVLILVSFIVCVAYLVNGILRDGDDYERKL